MIGVIYPEQRDTRRIGVRLLLAHYALAVKASLCQTKVVTTLRTLPCYIAHRLIVD
jgi:hypothetical protein